MCKWPDAGRITSEENHRETSQENSIPKAPLVVEPERPAVDPVMQVQLVASVSDGTRREAWLFDARLKQMIPLHEQTSFEAAGTSGRVLTIGEDFVLVDVNGTSQRLKLGRSLRDILPATDEELLPTAMRSPRAESLTSPLNGDDDGR